MTAITDKKLRDKLMKEKTLKIKKTIEMIKQNTYEKKKQEKYKTRNPDHNERKTNNQRRTNIKDGTIRYQAENKNNRKSILQILQCTKLEPNTQMSGTRFKLQQLRKERTLRTGMQAKNKECPNSENNYR